MNHYLMVFDRARGAVIEEKVYTDRHLAMRARFDAERRHRADAGIEVVVLTAESEADLHRTHARYFSRLREMFQSALANPPLGRTDGACHAPS